MMPGAVVLWDLPSGKKLHIIEDVRWLQSKHAFLCPYSAFRMPRL